MLDVISLCDNLQILHFLLILVVNIVAAVQVLSWSYTDMCCLCTVQGFCNWGSDLGTRCLHVQHSGLKPKGSIARCKEQCCQKTGLHSSGTAQQTFKGILIFNELVFHFCFLQFACNCVFKLNIIDCDDIVDGCIF